MAKMHSMKEAASNIAASAKSGMEKTKATVQEKVEMMTAHDPAEKDMATQRKKETFTEAELNKQAVRVQNTAARQHSSTTGQNPTSALPGHGTGLPHGRVEEGVVESHPIGINTGLGGTTAHNPRVGGGNTKTGYGTGGGYS